MAKEIWKDIAGYEGYYKISNLGNLKSITRKVAAPFNTVRIKYGKIHKKQISIYGYSVKTLQKDGKIKMNQVHRLVSQAFIPNPENKRTVNHKNGIKTDNRVENLEWATYSENEQHAYDNGLRKITKQEIINRNYPARYGSNHANSKLKERDIYKIFALKRKGKRLIDIAKIYGVHYSLIGYIVNRKIWKHVSC